MVVRVLTANVPSITTRTQRKKQLQELSRGVLCVHLTGVTWRGKVIVIVIVILCHI
eukprot:SAG11_NODE_3507_length_2406_cov_1.843520_5_plen_56_part_00